MPLELPIRSNLPVPACRLHCNFCPGLTQDLARGQGEWPAAEEMNVEVKDGLSGSGADVEDGTVSLLDVALPGNVGGSKMAAADQFRVFVLGFFESGEVFLGDDKDVCRGLGMDVFKGEDVIVLINFFRRNFFL
jgi:hypothetical protein